MRYSGDRGPAAPPGGAAVRRANAVALVETLRGASTPLTVSELAELTRLSRPTVDAVVSELALGGLVTVRQPSPGARGRPARSVTFDADAGSVVGIDVGPHAVRVLVADLAGRITARTDQPLPRALEPGGRLRHVRATVVAALREGGSSVRRLRAAGLAVPGILDHDDRVTQSLAVPDWVGTDLGRELRAGWRCPVAIENDIKLAALAEQRLGAARGVRDLTFWTLGHRVSLALIINGAILQGRHRVAGELGSRRGMRWTASSHRGQLRWSSRPTAAEVFAAAADGDRAATDEVAAFCAELAPTFASVLLTVDPELVVVGGGLSRSGATLRQPLQAAVHRLLITDAKPPFATSHLGADGPVLGALGLAFQRWSTQIVGIDAVTPPWPVWRPPDPAPTTTSPTSRPREEMPQS